jgi:hypothetical protein
MGRHVVALSKVACLATTAAILAALAYSVDRRDP